MKTITPDNIARALKNAYEIIRKDKYFNSAVLIPLFEKDKQLHVLFEKRANQIRQGGEVSFPGGEFDKSKDEDFRQTALRETVEELGIETDKIILLGKLGTLIAPMGVTVDAFVGYLNIQNILSLSFDKREVEKLFSLPLEFFLVEKPEMYYVKLEVHPDDRDDNGNIVQLLPAEELGLPLKYSKPWKKGQHRILVYKTSEEIIWGITAEIIFEFAKLIKDER